MNVYLIRHEEVGKKYLHRYIGSTDVGLSHEGKKQAKLLGNYFKTIPVTSVYVSTLKRAKQTAKLLCMNHLPLYEDKRLCEIDLGEWEGKTSRQVKRMIPKDVACETVTSGGELYADFVKRIQDFINDLRKNSPNDTIVVVTHKGVIREMYKQLLADDALIVEQSYGCINHIVLDKDKVEVKLTNYVYE